jgi:hypothetical protein
MSFQRERSESVEEIAELGRKQADTRYVLVALRRTTARSPLTDSVPR